MMSGSFPTKPKETEPAGGLIIVEPEGGGCSITVSFRLPPDIEGCGDLPASVGGVFQFEYKRTSFNPSAERDRLTKEAEALLTNNRYVNVGRAFEDDASLRIALHPFARIGTSLYWDLFGLGSSPRQEFFSSELGRDNEQAYGCCLRKWLEIGNDFNVICPRGYIPWNLLYDGDVPKKLGPVDPTKFWCFGKRFQLMANGLCNRLPIRSDYRVCAGIEEDDEEIRDGVTVHESLEHPFRAVPTDRIKVGHDLVEVFDAFGSSDVLYIFGHASGSTTGLEYGGIGLNGQTLLAADLKGWFSSERALPKQRPVLIFLNGCKTGVGASQGETIPGALVELSRDRFCFISTLASVPGWAAAEFASGVLRRFLHGHQPLGTATTEARLEMLTKYRSPIGLFYAAYGRLETHVSS